MYIHQILFSRFFSYNPFYVKAIYETTLASSQLFISYTCAFLPFFDVAFYLRTFLMPLPGGHFPVITQRASSLVSTYKPVQFPCPCKVDQVAIMLIFIVSFVT